MIITLNVNGLNAPIKGHRLAEWIQKQNPYICSPQETNFRPRDTYRLKVREWKMIFHGNRNQKRPGVAILISDKIDFKIKTITRDKEGHYIMIKGSIQDEDITIVNIYAPNTGAPQYVRQMLTVIKGEINSNEIIVGDFNTPLSPMDRSSKMKIKKEKRKRKKKSIVNRKEVSCAESSQIERRYRGGKRGRTIRKHHHAFFKAWKI